MRGFQNGLILKIWPSNSRDIGTLVLHWNFLDKRGNLHIWNGTKKKIFEGFFAIFCELTHITLSKMTQSLKIRAYLMQNFMELDMNLSQWCNLTLARWFWVTKVCLQVSKISQICLFGRLTGRATFWKANFENYSRYSLIKWYQFLSI